MSEEIDYLTVQDLIELGTSIVEGFRMRDIGLLESAAHRPKTTVYGEEAYPTLELKIGALIHALARHHGLIDGNKRIARSAGRLFALLNRADIEMDVDTAEKMILRLACGELDIAECSVMVRDHLI
jgi:death-on-curing protein